ncbi:MAG: MBL fold metallo-hydrolase [Bacteroidetes bacterium]|nr:MBL fold metallo-hydrolase [Bacteroidota bacterium]
MKLHTINTGFFKLDGGAMFGVVPKTMWQKLNPPDENNMCTWAMRCLLIEDGNKLILVDNGIGNKQDEKFFGHYYLHGDDTLEKSIRALGFGLDDITDVFLTHLHFDHCGGSVRRTKDGNGFESNFSKATFWSNENHWKWATEPNAREKASFLKENILPIQESGQLKFTNDGADLFPNVKVKYMNGHTDGMMLPHIQYKGRTIVFVADLLPSAAHLPIPFIMAYDTRPLISMNEKAAFIKEAQEKDFILFFEHDPHHECCDLKMTEKGVRPNNFFKLSEIV